MRAARALLFLLWVLAVVAGPWAPAGAGDAALPSVLSAEDVARYRAIFEVQEDGRWQKARRLIAELDNPILMGHVDFQRLMHPTDYRSPYHELKDWLAEYADHPGARRVYRLALRRRPADHAYPRRPVSAEGFPGAPATYDRGNPYRSAKARSASAARAIKRQVRRNVLRTRLSVTEDYLRSAKVARVLDGAEIDEARTEVASAWYHYGRDDKARTLTEGVIARHGAEVPLAYWIAGLAAWRGGDYRAAGRHFEALAEHARPTRALRAAGAYWAARAALKTGRPEAVSRFLRLGLAAPYSFYGLLSADALGIRLEPPVGAELDEDAPARWLAEPRLRRVLALIEVGRSDLAGEEFRLSGGWDDERRLSSLTAFAATAGLAAEALQLAEVMIARGADPADPVVLAGRYPIPHWRPQGGFSVDRALVYAVMRQESRFRNRARSRDGAAGLMQILPSTARYVTGERISRHALHDPAVNLDIGQRYLRYLLDKEIVGGDLFRLAVAYNGGPGNLIKWEKRTDFQDDPLLFIESIPSRETRLFIERTITNFWIYRARLGQERPSLFRLAGGGWPDYRDLDQRNTKTAKRKGADVDDR